MDNMEFNKIFAAVLVAGIVASFSGFVSHKLLHPHELEKDVVTVEGVETVSGGGGDSASGPEPILAMIAAADLSRAEKISKACAACHTFTKGGANGVGPNLWGVFGQKKAMHSGFAYSDAMKAKEGVWNYAALNQFLYKPKKYVEGTKMNFIGLKKPEDRAAVVAWLRTLSESPAALPSESEIAAEQAELAPPAPEGSAPVVPAADGKADVSAAPAMEPPIADEKKPVQE